MADMDTAEQTVLLIDQMRKKFTECFTFTSVTAKALDALLDKIKSSLGAEAGKFYSQDSNTRGLGILQKLEGD